MNKKERTRCRCCKKEIEKPKYIFEGDILCRKCFIEGIIEETKRFRLRLRQKDWDKIDDELLECIINLLEEEKTKLFPSRRFVP